MTFQAVGAASGDRAVLLGLVASLTVACVVLFVLLARRTARLRRRTEAAAVIKNALETMSDGFVLWDKDNRLVTCNEAYRRIYEISRPFLVQGALFDDIIRQGAEAGQYPDAEGRIDEFVGSVIAWQRAGTTVIERRLSDGRWYKIAERRMPGGGTVGTRTDITALKSALADLAAANRRAEAAAAEAIAQSEAARHRDEALNERNTLFEAALANMSHGLTMIDATGRLIVGNRRFCELFSLDEAMLAPGISAADLHRAIQRSGLLDEESLSQIWSGHRDLVLRGNPVAFVVTTRAGRAIRVTERPLAEGGCVAIYEDITSRRLAESRVRFLAHHDDLTKLPNRAHFRSRIDEFLNRMRRGGPPFALLYLDLDRFKDVNDTFGHPAGDALLKAVVRRMRHHLLPQDIFARLGGDEFAILRTATGAEDGADAFGQRLVEALDRPFDIMGHRVAIGLSVGIATAERSDNHADAVLRRADLALYQAKKSGRGTCFVYETGLEQRWRRQLALEADLREALEAEKLSLAYQPIFDLKTGSVFGYEALVRWHHPERGQVSPAEFVPLAEKSGLIDELGSWVLRRACREVAGLPGEPKIAVNLSPQQLRCQTIVDVVSDALKDAGLDPRRLELEITETALLTEVVGTASLLRKLRDLGPGIVLDDFGTGYSSLSHLRSFPLSKIKIDRSFVQEMATNRESAAIVTSIVELARRLGMRTTAEGVETAELLDLVRKVNCTEAQGYHLGRPVSILEVMDGLGKRIYAAAPTPLLRLA